MKKELTLKIGFDTTSESVSDLTSLILEIIELSNDNSMYVVQATIENKVVFSDKGFSGQLRKRYWDWDLETDL